MKLIYAIFCVILLTFNSKPIILEPQEKPRKENRADRRRRR